MYEMLKDARREFIGEGQIFYHIHNVDNWENIPCYKKDWLIK